MNRELFAAMQSQLVPGEETLRALSRRLEEERSRRRGRRAGWAALVACAVLVLAAFPVYRALHPPLHDYATVPGGGAIENTTALQGADAGTGRDVPNTGDMPNVGEDGAVQEKAATAYQNLMEHFQAAYGPDRYPDWYGGAYINSQGRLTVCVVDPPQDDKALYLEIEELCRSQDVLFREVDRSLTRLNELQEQVVELLKGTGLAWWGCGVDEMENRITVQLPAEDKTALAGLHRLDPAGDAIYVTIQAGESIGFFEAEGPGPDPVGAVSDSHRAYLEDLPGSLEPQSKQPHMVPRNLPTPHHPGAR